jgi:hypothetical protein
VKHKRTFPNIHRLQTLLANTVITYSQSQRQYIANYSILQYVHARPVIRH